MSDVPFPARRAMQNAIWSDCIQPGDNEWTTWSDSIALAECAADALTRAGWRVVAAQDPNQCPECGGLLLEHSTTQATWRRCNVCGHDVYPAPSPTEEWLANLFPNALKDEIGAHVPFTKPSTADVVAGLERVRKGLCCYVGDRCDCKYGFDGSQRSGEQTGCPELRAAMAEIERLLAAASVARNDTQ